MINNDNESKVKEVKMTDNLNENMASNTDFANNEAKHSPIENNNDDDKVVTKHVVTMPNNGRTIEINRDSSYGPKSKIGTFFLNVCWQLAVMILWVYSKAFLGLKIEGKQIFKDLKKQKKGFIIVSNHIHVMDTPLIAVAVKPYRVQFTSIESNFAIPVGGRILSFFGTIPMPESPAKLRYIFDYINKTLSSGGVVHMFPEGVLLPYDNHVRGFNKGAFMCAEKAGVDILPIVFTQRKAKGPFKYLKKYRCSYTARVLEPIETDNNLKKREKINDLEKRTREAMVSVIEKYDENVVSIDYSEYI